MQLASVLSEYAQDSLLTLGGFQYAGSIQFTSLSLFGLDLGSTSVSGMLANRYVKYNASEDIHSGFQITFDDPMEEIIAFYRNMAFRSSVQVGLDNPSWTNLTQRVSFTGTEAHDIYVTDFGYMAAAVILSILSVCAVAPTFWGWWEFGRDVGLSPFEIAKAFDAPVLQGIGSNMDEEQLLKHAPVGVFRYGEVEDGEEEQSGNTTRREVQLRLDFIEHVKTIRKGEKY